MTAWSAADYQAVAVDGARELRRALAKAHPELKAELKDANRTVAQIVTTRAAQIVPVAPASMTTAKPGLLRDSIRAGATQTAAIARAGKKRVPYAGPIHWGWFRRGIKPTLFLTLAAHATEPRWIETYFSKVEKVTEQIANSTRGQA